MRRYFLIAGLVFGITCIGCHSFRVGTETLGKIGLLADAGVTTLEESSALLQTSTVAAAELTLLIQETRTTLPQLATSVDRTLVTYRIPSWIWLLPVTLVGFLSAWLWERRKTRVLMRAADNVLPDEIRSRWGAEQRRISPTMQRAVSRSLEQVRLEGQPMSTRILHLLSKQPNPPKGSTHHG